MGFLIKMEKLISFLLIAINLTTQKSVKYSPCPGFTDAKLLFTSIDISPYPIHPGAKVTTTYNFVSTVDDHLNKEDHTVHVSVLPIKYSFKIDKDIKGNSGNT